MKKFYEGVKDFLYDSIDYIIIVGIIGIVVFVISWRLDLLFAKDAVGIDPKTEVIIDNNNRNDENKKDSEDMGDVENPDEIDVVDNNQEENPTVNPGNTEQPSNKIVKITIPAGSLPSKIGTILEENGLVSSKNDFVIKSQELKLDTKLKSGTFEIDSNSTLEEIIKLIAK